MRLFRFGASGQEKPGVELKDGTRIDVTAFGEDYTEQFFGSNGLARLEDWLSQSAATAPRVAASERFGPAICRPSKIVCVGLNFKDHAKESGLEPPKEPVLFFKATSSIIGPNDPVTIPKGSKKTDWEVEFAIVIERKASYVSEADALKYVAGYVLHNDYSEREFQIERGGQWVKGKSCDTFAPLGPYLVTKDDAGDIDNLSMWLKVNGELVQNGNTKNFIFNVPFVVSYISQFMTLLPGDVISTGTPAGVGLGFNPPRYLKAGDVVELGIQGLGESRQELRAFGG